MLDLIIPILFVAILFISKQVVNKVLSPHVESAPFPEGEIFPEIEMDAFWEVDKEEESRKVKRSPRIAPEQASFEKFDKVVFQSSSVGNTLSMRTKGTSSGKGRGDLAKMLRTSNGARRAFIYSELLNRKYE